MVAPLLMLCGELLALPQEVHSRHHHWVDIFLVCWLARPKALTQPSFGATSWPARRHSLGWIFFGMLIGPPEGMAQPLWFDQGRGVQQTQV
jgi:hypothetical protein